MKKDELERAIEIKEEMHELKMFIHTASSVWTGKLTLKSFIASSFGFLKSKEYHMNIDIKNKVLNVIKNHYSNLEKELSDM